MYPEASFQGLPLGQPLLIMGIFCGAGWLVLPPSDLFSSALLLQAYPSQKPLAAWTRDLGQRVEQFTRWANTAHPPVLFWLSGFTFPTGFLTAVLQASARQNNVWDHLGVGLGGRSQASDQWGLEGSVG